MRVGIVDDSEESRRQIATHLESYGKEHDIRFIIETFSSGVDFLADYHGDYDVVFLDMQMPIMDGMETAERLRKSDATVLVVFVTNFAQYAIKGYKVQAFDYVLKPVSYGNFRLLMDKLTSLFFERKKKTVALIAGSGMVRLSVSEIYYVESNLHNLIYHTKQGEITKRGKLDDAEKGLKEFGFSRCANSFLVNMECVENIKGKTAIVAGTSIPITRGKRIAFLAEVAEFIGKGGIL